MKLCKGFARRWVRAYILGRLRFSASGRPSSRASSLPQWFCVVPSTLVGASLLAIAALPAPQHFLETPCPTSSWSKTTPHSLN
nr:hypothetical protein C1892_23630 [Pseudomonas sp. MPBD7-1]